MSHLEWVLVGFAIIAFAAVAVVVGVLLTRDRGADSRGRARSNALLPVEDDALPLHRLGECFR